VSVIVGCASSAETEDPGAVADDSALNVNVCVKGDALPSVEGGYDYFSQFHGFGSYAATTGARINLRIPDSRGGPEGEPVPAEPSIPFNPVEFGVEAWALSVSWVGPNPLDWEATQSAFDDALRIDASQIDACRGVVSIAANARVKLGTITDPKRIDWFCVPGSVEGDSCALRDGVKVGLTARTIAQTQGFVRTLEPLNLRSGPTTGDGIVTTIPKNAIVRVTGKIRNRFYSISYDGKSGWGHDDFLVPFSGTAVTTEALNLRAIPSTESKVLQVIPKGTRVRVMEGMGQFMEVSGDAVGRHGFASGVFLGDPRQN